MLRNFVAFYGYEPVFWLAVSVTCFFGAVVAATIYAAGSG
jgi:hypothetical protein